MTPVFNGNEWVLFWFKKEHFYSDESLIEAQIVALLSIETATFYTGVQKP